MTAMLASNRSDNRRDQQISSIADIIRNRLSSFGNRTAIRYVDGSTYKTVNFMEYVGNIDRTLRLFLPPSENQYVVCTFVMNRPEWDMVALATLYSGNILFPLDTKMFDAEVKHLLEKSTPDFVLVSLTTRNRMKGYLKELGLSPKILIADMYGVFEDAQAPPIGQLEDHEERLSALPFPSDGNFPEASERLERTDLVVARYATSGTTTLPKVVQVTHGNVLAQVNEGMDVLNLRKAEDLLNIGPYTHIATLLEFLVTKAKGFTVTYFTREADEDKVLEDEIKKLKKLGVRCLAERPTQDT